MNYTRPNDENHTDSPQDWLAGALIFARALGIVLPQGQGIVVAPHGDAKQFFDDELIIVANLGTQIQVLPLSKDDMNPGEEYNEGDFIIFEEEKESEEDGEA